MPCYTLAPLVVREGSGIGGIMARVGTRQDGGSCRMQPRKGGEKLTAAAAAAAATASSSSAAAPYKCSKQSCCAVCSSLLCKVWAGQKRSDPRRPTIDRREGGRHSQSAESATQSPGIELLLSHSYDNRVFFADSEGINNNQNPSPDSDMVSPTFREEARLHTSLLLGPDLG